MEAIRMQLIFSLTTSAQWAIIIGKAPYWPCGNDSIHTQGDIFSVMVLMSLMFVISKPPRKQRKPTANSAMSRAHISTFTSAFAFVSTSVVSDCQNRLRANVV